jgi:hypothetical protein
MTEYTMPCEIKTEDFTASVTISYSMIVSDEDYWTDHEHDCARRAIAVHILKQQTKEIRDQMDDMQDYETN